MGSKRSATTELNQDNWNEEHQPEEPGVFQVASEEALGKRVLKTAKRRLQSKDGTAKSAFGAFTGFKAATTTTTNSSPFRFLTSTTSTSTQVHPLSSLLTLKFPNKSNTNTLASSTNGAAQSTENGASKKEESMDTATVSQASPVSNASAIKSENDDEKESKKPAEYFAKLKGLNESVAQWIKTHVDANPLCILTPIFRDYEKYLKEIEPKGGSETAKASVTSEQEQKLAFSYTHVSDSSKDATSTNKAPESSPFGGVAKKSLPEAEGKSSNSIFGNTSSSNKSIFGNTEQLGAGDSTVAQTKQTADPPKSIFGNIEKIGKCVFGNASPEKNPFLSKPPSTSDTKAEETAPKAELKTTTSFPSSQTGVPIFSFGQSSATSSASAGFSFGSAKPFTFAAQSVKAQESEEKQDEAKDDEDEEPPKPEIKPITEEGSIYEQRCKVFVKKDGNFGSRGVGILFLKPTPNDKTQLIVRAETSLGNLLLNTLLTESIPVKRMNPNTIMLVCLPTPESTPPPVPVLLRVKTSEDADMLLENLNKHRK